ncbi:hypothetical protein Taro_053995 [Colocasia esculenta]|uniref:Uncharacterized protein n=1 Tax=Colocasia esculenta TaxID=4460 RepID=A0A843XPR7_COLES|nr:hypothetical protein [Colocasia esculenta]
MEDVLRTQGQEMEKLRADIHRRDSEMDDTSQGTVAPSRVPEGALDDDEDDTYEAGNNYYDD